MKHVRRPLYLIGIASVLLLLVACGSTSAAPTSPAQAPTGSIQTGASGKVTLIIGGYSTPAEAIGTIIPLFQKMWKDKTGQDVQFQQSYQGSGAQSRAIVNGFEADLAVLSVDSDVQRIADAGLITHDWKTKGPKGVLTNSLVVLAVRKGDPKSIKDWNDLAQKGLNILTPDPQTSGGAQWNVMAMYGAAKRGFVQGAAKDDEQGAYNFVKSVFKNVSALDKDARTSLTNYEKGVGDVAITYENEVLLGKQKGQTYDYVIPSSTILIECPIAVVDKYVDKHGTRAVAEAFRDFLWTPDAQRIFAKYGFRSVDSGVAQETKSQFPAVQDLFQISYFGGWTAVTKQYFSQNGVYSKLIQEVQTEKSQ